MISKKLTTVIVAILLLTGSAVGAWQYLAKPPSRPLVEITLQMPWTANAGYAGFYMADDKGDFAKQGLKVKMVPGGPGFNLPAILAAGKADLAIINGAEIIRARESGIPLKAVACTYKRSPLVFITMKASGLDHPRKFANKKTRASNQNKIVLSALLSKFGVPHGDLKVLRSRDVKDLRDGKFDIWAGYSAISLEQIRRQGWIDEVNVFHPDNFGVHFYYSCVVFMDKMIQERPDIVQGFLHASMKDGWRRAFKDPKAAAKLVEKYGAVFNIEHEAITISKMLPLIDAGTGDIGWVEKDGWESMIQTIYGERLIKTPMRADDVFDDRFLKAIYNRK